MAIPNLNLWAPEGATGTELVNYHNTLTSLQIAGRPYNANRYGAMLALIYFRKLNTQGKQACDAELLSLRSKRAGIRPTLQATDRSVLTRIQQRHARRDRALPMGALRRPSFCSAIERSNMATSNRRLKKPTQPCNR